MFQLMTLNQLNINFFICLFDYLFIHWLIGLLVGLGYFKKLNGFNSAPPDLISKCK